MNILFLTISQLDDISSRNIYSDLMRKFVSNGHNVYIMCPFERKVGRKTELFQSCGAKILGVRTLNIQKTNVVEKGIATLLLEYQFMSAIKRYLDNISFDLILYSTPPITFNRVIDYVKHKYNAKSYLLLKDIFPQNAVDLGMFSTSSIFHWMFRRKERELYRLSDYIGCMSPANVKFIVDHNPEIPEYKVHVNPNSVEPLLDGGCDKYAVRRKYKLPTNLPIFIYGGNLGKPQGIDFLLQVLEHYHTDQRLYFLVVGNGTEYGKVERWFAKYRPTNAQLIARLPKQDYDQLVQSCDVGMIFLDRRFTIPNYPSRLLSYLEYKMPVIAATDINTDIGKLAEQNGYGFWSESGDIKSFAVNVERLLLPDVIPAMGQKGYDYLLANYTVDNSYDIIMEKYNSYV